MSVVMHVVMMKARVVVDVLTLIYFTIAAAVACVMEHDSFNFFKQNQKLFVFCKDIFLNKNLIHIQLL